MHVVHWQVKTGNLFFFVAFKLVPHRRRLGPKKTPAKRKNSQGWLESRSIYFKCGIPNIALPCHAKFAFVNNRDTTKCSHRRSTLQLHKLLRRETPHSRLAPTDSHTGQDAPVSPKHGILSKWSPLLGLWPTLSAHHALPKLFHYWHILQSRLLAGVVMSLWISVGCTSTCSQPVFGVKQSLELS